MTWGKGTTLSKFQELVSAWLHDCFGLEVAYNKLERNHRFLEEALELVQACGCSKDEAIQLVDYVYGRQSGEIEQEVGGVMVTLAALCHARGIRLQQCSIREYERVLVNVEKIRAKQAAKPKHSPLPQHECSAEAPCCERRDEYNGYASCVLIFTCPKRCACHD